MLNKNIYNLRSFRLCSLTLGLILFIPAFAHADAGIPMIVLTFPSMVGALIPVALIEAFVYAKTLKIEYKRALRPSFFANLLSTLIGIPLAWVLLFCVEILFMLISSLGAVTRQVGTLQKILETVLGAAWLGPYEGDLWWMIPTAAAVGLIPAYFVSVYIEFKVTKRYLPAQDPIALKKAVKTGNLITYALLLAACIGLFVSLYFKSH